MTKNFKRLISRNIQSEFFDAFDDSVNDVYYECFKNPDAKEFNDIIGDAGAFRGMMLENGDLYVWNQDLLHSKALDFFKIPNGLHIYTYDDEETIGFYITNQVDMEYIYNCFKNCQTIYTKINSSTKVAKIDTNYYKAKRDEYYSKIETVQDILNFK